jgi:hypothetical protein
MILEQVRDERTKANSRDHPDTLTTTNELAVSYMMADRIPDAQRLWADLLPTARRVFGLNHTWTQSIGRNWCQALDALGEFTKADELRRELGIEQ